MRTLTEAEVQLVRRWARRNRIVLWLLLPIALLLVVGLAAAGIASVVDGHWLTGAVFVVLSPLVAMAVVLMWRSMGRYNAVDVTTPVETRRGVLRQKPIGKSYTLAIGDLAVVFASRELRHSVELDEPIIAEVVMGSPVLVITARRDGKRTAD